MRNMNYTTPLFITILGSTFSLSTIASDAESRFFEPFDQCQISRTGVPIIHGFGVEPALTGRDLITSYSYVSGDDFTEQEAELELEWAFTRQLGIIVELPYTHENPTSGSTEEGFGALIVVPRATIYEGDRNIFTIQTEFELPAGSEAFGSETAIAPGIATWHDLGNWYTLSTQLGVEHNFDADETEFVFGVAFAKSFSLNPTPCSENIGTHSHSHSQGILNIHAEFTGSSPTTGEDRGDFGVDGLLGVSYGISQDMDVRFGYQVPLTTPDNYDHTIKAGLIYHF